MKNPLRALAARFYAEPEGMTLFDRREPVVVGIENSVTVSRSSDPQIIAMLGGAPAASGFAVTPETSMRVSAVFAAVRLLAGTLASLPVSIYREVDGGRESIQPELWWLLNEEPIGNWTAAAMWSWVMQSRMMRGDGFVEIVRSGASIRNLRPHHPDLVVKKRVGDSIVYGATDENGRQYPVHQDDMLHYSGFGFNGLQSMSAIQWGAFQSIGVALAADTFSGSFFANGAAPKHVLTTKAKLDEDQVQLLRGEYIKKYAGAQNAGTPMVLPKDVELKEMSMTSVDAQLLESRKFQIVDIARAFGVPAHLIGAQESTSSWGAGVQAQTLGFIKFSMQPHLDIVRQESNRKLFRRASPFVEHKMEALMSGDAKAESDYFRQALGGAQGPGWMTLNEVRRVKNMPPVPGGDVVYRPDGLLPPKPAHDSDPKEDDEKAGTTNS